MDPVLLPLGALLLAFLVGGKKKRRKRTNGGTTTEPPGDGGLQEGGGRGGTRRDTDDPYKAGEVDPKVIAENDEEVLTSGLLPGTLYLAGTNVFYRGFGLIYAWLNDVQPVVVSRPEVLAAAAGHEDLVPRDADLVLVATSPDYVPGARAYFGAFYADEFAVNDQGIPFGAQPEVGEQAFQMYKEAIAWATSPQLGGN